MAKVHYLKPGLFGPFENLSTYCGAVGHYVRDAYIRHYRTLARFDYTNDWKKVTCKSCLKEKGNG